MARSVLFVCLGNICRSPMAEAIMKKLLVDRGCESQWLVDSAAVGPWHVGEPPDPRTLACLEKHGLSTEHRVRTVKKEDFHNYEFILCMDDENMEDLQLIQPKNTKAILKLLGSYDKRAEDEISDVYYGGEEGFEVAFQLLWQACSDFLDTVGPD